MYLNLLLVISCGKNEIKTNNESKTEYSDNLLSFVTLSLRISFHAIAEQLSIASGHKKYNFIQQYLRKDTRFQTNFFRHGNFSTNNRKGPLMTCRAARVLKNYFLRKIDGEQIIEMEN